MLRKYEYRRRLPHYQKSDRVLFVTFCKLLEPGFCGEARDLVLQHCLFDHGKKYELHAAVVMPEHVHLLFTPLRDPEGWPYTLPQILKVLKGASARSVNRLLGHSEPVWQDESFDHVLRHEESLHQKIEYLRQNPVRRGLVRRPEDYRWLWVNPSLCGAGSPVNPCGAGTPARRCAAETPCGAGTPAGPGADKSVRSTKAVAFSSQKRA